MAWTIKLRILLGAMGILLWATCGADAASFEDKTLQREGRAWSERSDKGSITAQDEGWATIAGDGWGSNRGHAIYEFHLPRTAGGSTSSIELSWYGKNVSWYGVVVYVYVAAWSDWAEVEWDSSRTEGWRGPYPIAAETCLENNDGLTNVLRVKFETPGSWDSYQLRTVELTFDYEDDALHQTDLEASYACALAAVQVDEFNIQVLEYDPEEDFANGEIVWMGISSVLQFASHLQAIDPSSLLDLVNLPSDILRLYEDIFGFRLFQPIDVGLLKLRYTGATTPGAIYPKPPSMSSYLTSLRAKFRETARRLGGHEDQAGSSREGSLEDLYTMLSHHGVDYYKGGNPYDSLSGHASKWEEGWHWAATPFGGDVKNMGLAASKVGAIMHEFGDAWLNSFVRLEVTTSPEGLGMEVNGSVHAVPYAWHSIKGTTHSIAVPSEAQISGKGYHFVRWNDGLEQSHVISPITDQTYVAEYQRDTGSLLVTISPQGAVNAGAAWKLSTESTWHSSGYTLTAIPTGQVEVEFKSISGWSKPPNQTVRVEKDTTTSTTGNYTADVAILQVTIDPPPAVSAGAKWKLVTDGIWQNSGATVIYPAGTHTLQFKDISGWDKPPDEQINLPKNETITIIRRYIRHVGSLKVTILPQAAVDEGAKWRLSLDMIWHNSGETISYPVGYYTLEFKSIDGWNEPSNKQVIIEDGAPKEETGTYTLERVITVISPNGGEVWQVGEVRNILWSATGLSGDVELRYSTDSGATYHNLIATVPAADGGHSWQVPNVSTTNCRVRVLESGGGISDESDADFQIALPPSSIGRGPDSLYFGSWESTMTFEVWNAAAQTLDYDVADDADWVSIDPAGGLSEDSNDRKIHVVTVDRSGFVPDEEKTAVITISSDGADNSPQTIAVIAHRSSLGSISGRVTKAADGSPIQELWVQVFDYVAGFFRGWGCTDSNGVYEIDGVQPGTYRVVVYTYHTDYMAEYYDDAREEQNATPVGVDVGQRASGIDFALTIGGTITGTVTRDSDGAPVPDLWVTAYDYDTGSSSSDMTDPNGAYEIMGLCSGLYRVGAFTSGTEYVDEYYDNVFEYQDATPVQVIEGQVTSNRDFGLLVGGRISGTVTRDSNDAPIPGLWVYAEDHATGWGESAITDANGVYSINKLRPGAYKVWVSTYNTAFMREYYDNALEEQNATPVDVNVGQHVSGIDFGLAIGGTITGTVTRDSDGGPVPDLLVSAYDYDTGSSSGDSTDPNGTYEIMGLPTGIYRVTVSTYGTEYVYEYYDDVFNRDDATPVTVVVGEATEYVDFGLGLGASISGFVKDSSGSAVEDVSVNCSGRDAYYAGSVRTEPTGFYHVGRLPAGYVYRIAAYPPSDSDYVITRICLKAPEAEDYTAPDIVLERGALTVSGTVTDKATRTPLEGMYVQCNLDDLDDISGSSASTDPNGRYTLTNLPSGRVEFRVEPESSDHACIGSRFELTESVDNLDFALPQGAVLHGKVLDAETAEPIAEIHVTYWNSQQEAWQDAYTKGDGRFTLRQLPPGIGEVRASPAVSTGYAWSLPEGGSWIFLQEGEEKQNRMIALRKGALVAGYIKDANGIPLGNIGYDWKGKMCEGWRYVSNTRGYYQIRLPLGTYSITLDEENGLTVLPTEVTIDDVNQVTQVDDIVVYSRLTGSQISGNILNPSASIKTGDFMVYAFEAGTVIDVNTWATIQPINEGERLDDAGPFVLAPLPLGSDYDIWFCTRTEYPLDSHIDSVVLQDRQPGIPLGTGNVNLYYGSEGGTVIGTVRTIDGRPVMGADVLLTAYDTGSFAAFAVSDCNGAYEIYNVRPGTYVATAVHSKYLNASTTVEVVDGVPAIVNTIIMPFAGEKEGPNLNGDGTVNLVDIASFSSYYGATGCNAQNNWCQGSDFNQDSTVDFMDLTRLAENWLWRAVWYSE